MMKVKPFVKLVLILFLTSYLFSNGVHLSAVYAESGVMVQQKAYLSAVEGEVWLQRSGGLKEFKAEEGMPLYQEDLLRTGENGAVTIIFEDHSETTLGSYTKLLVSQLSEGEEESFQSSLKAITGQVWNKTKRLLNIADQYEVETPTSVMGVRGTLFLVYVDKENTVELSVFDGKVAVSLFRNSVEDEVDETTYGVGEQLHVQLEDENLSIAKEMDLAQLMVMVDSVVLEHIIMDMLEVIEENRQEMEQALNQFEDSWNLNNMMYYFAESMESEALLNLLDRLVESAMNSERAVELEERLSNRGVGLQQILEQAQQSRSAIEEQRRNIIQAAEERGISVEEIVEMLQRNNIELSLPLEQDNQTSGSGEVTGGAASGVLVPPASPTLPTPPPPGPPQDPGQSIIELEESDEKKPENPKPSEPKPGGSKPKDPKPEDPKPGEPDPGDPELPEPEVFSLASSSQQDSISIQVGLEREDIEEWVFYLDGVEQARYVGPSVQSYIFADLDAGRNYQIKVEALNRAGHVIAIALESVTTQEAPPDPGPVQEIESATMWWGEGEHYHVEWQEYEGAERYEIVLSDTAAWNKYREMTPLLLIENPYIEDTEVIAMFERDKAEAVHGWFDVDLSSYAFGMQVSPDARVTVSAFAANGHLLAESTIDVFNKSIDDSLEMIGLSKALLIQWHDLLFIGAHPIILAASPGGSEFGALEVRVLVNGQSVQSVSSEMGMLIEADGEGQPIAPSTEYDLAFYIYVDDIIIAFAEQTLMTPAVFEVDWNAETNELSWVSYPGADYYIIEIGHHGGYIDADEAVDGIITMELDAELVTPGAVAYIVAYHAYGQLMDVATLELVAPLAVNMTEIETTFNTITISWDSLDPWVSYYEIWVNDQPNGFVQQGNSYEITHFGQGQMPLEPETEYKVTLIAHLHYSSEPIEAIEYVTTMEAPPPVQELESMVVWWGEGERYHVEWQEYEGAERYEIILSDTAAWNKYREQMTPLLLLENPDTEDTEVIAMFERDKTEAVHGWFDVDLGTYAFEMLISPEAQVTVRAFAANDHLLAESTIDVFNKSIDEAIEMIGLSQALLIQWYDFLFIGTHPIILTGLPEGSELGPLEVRVLLNGQSVQSVPSEMGILIEADGEGQPIIPSTEYKLAFYITIDEITIAFSEQTLTTPAAFEVDWNAETNELSWEAYPGADYYMIEIGDYEELIDATEAIEGVITLELDAELVTPGAVAHISVYHANGQLMDEATLELVELLELNITEIESTFNTITISWDSLDPWVSYYEIWVNDLPAGVVQQGNSYEITHFGQGETPLEPETEYKVTLIAHLHYSTEPLEAIEYVTTPPVPEIESMEMWWEEGYIVKWEEYEGAERYEIVLSDTTAWNKYREQMTPLLLLENPDIEDTEVIVALNRNKADAVQGWFDVDFNTYAFEMLISPDAQVTVHAFAANGHLLAESTIDVFNRSLDDSVEMISSSQLLLILTHDLELIGRYPIFLEGAPDIGEIGMQVLVNGQTVEEYVLTETGLVIPQDGEGQPITPGTEYHLAFHILIDEIILLFADQTLTTSDVFEVSLNTESNELSWEVAPNIDYYELIIGSSHFELSATEAVNGIITYQLDAEQITQNAIAYLLAFHASGEVLDVALIELVKLNMTEIQATSDTITISWEPLDFEVHHYEIRVNDQPAGVVYQGNSYEITHFGQMPLEPETEYEITLRAHLYTGGIIEKIVNVSTLETPEMEELEGVELISEQGTLWLSWNDFEGASMYELIFEDPSNDHTPTSVHISSQDQSSGYYEGRFRIAPQHFFTDFQTFGPDASITIIAKDGQAAVASSLVLLEGY